MKQSEVEEMWRVADLIKNAEVPTPNGPRSVGYYMSVGLDSFNHPHDRYQELLNAAAKAVIADRAAQSNQGEG